MTGLCPPFLEAIQLLEPLRFVIQQIIAVILLIEDVSGASISETSVCFIPKLVSGQAEVSHLGSILQTLELCF
jgi:hypothetical protein